ncbi:3-oxoacyl-(acyl-carrier-protein) synthase III [Paludibacter propionicigenes WB4]|uniref:Beta-ketoacyl-[acyl-carrier-protein] synthase III n=1 Tax=Paludibacter propionicigenes (strain DSM 17365 / JCM 13257 / WB4) TaxID=694427 RepID=E4T169_PALPW|nr:beta-ketoacyl-ACP synthase III [Paludibacter propionicigenes]ADQ78450.1 3-oxoacyl-(acyl-carrier-protein) synthase III [Paludibacter propionicigenes WB4]
MSSIRAVITGVGGYVPNYILNNEELSTMMDTNDEWITSRVGIKERRILKDENVGTSYLAAKAIEDLFAKTGTKPEEIDLIICGTTTADHIYPSCASMIAERMGIKNALAFDLQAACSGFIVSLTTGASFIESGHYKKVLIIGADKMSSITDYSDRTTAPLFGDGAGVVLLEPTNEEFGVIDSILRTDGIGVKHLHIKAGGSAIPTTSETIEKKMHYTYQEGAYVFKHAVTNMSEVSAEIMEKNNLSKDDIAWLVPHQANLRIIDAVVQRTGVEYDKVIINIDHFGNTSAATIPLGIWEAQSKFKKGDNIILTAFGAGFTWGAVYLKWGY